MIRLRELFLRALNALTRRSQDDRLRSEIAEHIALQTEDNVRAGMPLAEARRQAVFKFGSIESHTESHRDQQSLPAVDNFLRDAHYGLRMLRKSPGFTAVAVATLALGIGVTTAVFTVVNATLLRPLPFPHAENLVMLWDTYGTESNRAPVSYPNFKDWRDWNHSFSAMAAVSNGDSVITGLGEPLHVDGMVASADLFQLFDVQPVLGRRFMPSEDEPYAVNGTDAIIVSYRFWRQHLSGNAQAIGKILTVDGQRFTVVGVAPKDFPKDLGFGKCDFWTTAAPLAEKKPGSSIALAQERQMSFLNVFARLKPGTSLPQAQTDMDRISAELVRRYPADDVNEGVAIEPLQKELTSNIRPILLLLMVAVAVVLLIACADISGLLLARATGRQTEMTIRAALGARQLRIVQQLLIESLLLAFLGCVLGIWLSSALTGALNKFLDISWASQLTADWRVLTFAALASIVTAVLSGLAPALHLAKTDLVHGLKERGAGSGQGLQLQRWRKALVIAQVSLSAALLVSAGLLTRSLVKMQHVSLGFNPAHVITFPVSLVEQRHPQTTWAGFFENLTSRIASLPGVVSASAGSALPLQQGASRTVLLNVAGRDIPLSKRSGIVFAAITPRYFNTLGIAIKRGREFMDSDTASAQPVVIINEAAARQYFGSRDPLGRQIEPGMWDGSGSDAKMRTIVGIVADVKSRNLQQAASPMVYWPVAQIPSSGSMFVEARVLGEPTEIVNAIRSELHAADPELPLYNVWTLDFYLSQSLLLPRYNLLLVASFAALGLILTVIGLYGSVSYSVAQRTHEIGVRMALGAGSENVLRKILSEGLRMAMIGLAIGIPAATGFAHLLRSLLFGVTPSDVLTFVLVAAVLIAVAALASYIPARRATKVDPIVALRYE